MHVTQGVDGGLLVTVELVHGVACIGRLVADIVAKLTFVEGESAQSNGLAIVAAEEVGPVGGGFAFGVPGLGLEEDVTLSISVVEVLCVLGVPATEHCAFFIHRFLGIECISEGLDLEVSKIILSVF